jgi:hypothetical protein
MARVPVPQLVSLEATAADTVAPLATVVPPWSTTRCTGESGKLTVAWLPEVRVTGCPSVVAPASEAPSGALSTPHDPATTK